MRYDVIYYILYFEDNIYKTKILEDIETLKACQKTKSAKVTPDYEGHGP